MAQQGHKGAALVTGGSNGIGAAIVRSLEANGHEAIVLDIAAPGQDFSGTYYEVDLSDTKMTEQVLQDVVTRHRVLRLVNNIGTVRPALLEESSVEDFQAVMNLNATSALMCTQAVLSTMRAAGFGRVVSVTSRAVLGKSRRTAYAASKGAIAAMTRTWALELASSGITVNAVAPGPIATELFKANNPDDAPATRKILQSIPVQRVGTPDEVAHAVNFFLDDRSGFVTGQTLYVCGGMTIGLCKT